MKPGNILIDQSDQPFVVDFGLALREEDTGRGPVYAGTPAYMSPEQARGEGHRVDGRSDIFSLGAVFYRLLTGRRPFPAESTAEVLEQITTHEPRPPRQIDDSIPRELERICLRALSKRATERYTAAIDMAEDLRVFLAEHPGSARPSHESTTEVQAAADSTQVRDDSTVPEGDPVRIVPKGLRSFDAHDADFFLELLPGPRDRTGLPESLRFWKSRIEEVDPDRTFSVGLICGPSGCGKSSLVKAGLLPRLSPEVVSVYIEATPEETETRLLRALQKRCPSVRGMNLKDAVAALRRGPDVSGGGKVLIVIDQFEQWLHAQPEDESSPLVQALRQCDGGRVQCIVMVRDDFWMATIRFMRALEVSLDGENTAAVDLFSARHAEKVLGAFGCAFGTLPESPAAVTDEHRAFLEQAVSGLAEDGKVICVRLALFAEILKGRAWTTATLQEAGGARGVGVTFLEETFSATNAPPEQRYHQKAARRVLSGLLPESGTDIKGAMRSREELLEASGYAECPQGFADLIRILDRELRLITPTDPEGLESDDESSTTDRSGESYYQLTHDYLVPSLREWLTRKAKETRRGRAELRLSDSSTVWNAAPENRFLPSWWDHVAIRVLTDRRKWTPPQHTMMRRAARVHGTRTGLVVALVAAVVFAGVTIRGRTQASQMVAGLKHANTALVGQMIADLEDYRGYAVDDLRAAYNDSAEDSDAKLHAALALLPDDPSVLPFLRDRLLTVSAAQFQPVCDLLKDHAEELAPANRALAEDTSEPPAQRFQAACAVAIFDPDSVLWQDETFASFVAGYLTGVLPSELLPWRTALRPVREPLRAPLAAIYRDADAGEQRRSFAADTLADYLADDASRLFDLFADANEKQFGPMFDKLVGHRDEAISLASAAVRETLSEDAPEADRAWLAIRQANAAVLLLRVDAADPVWPLLKHSPDPRTRSYIIHWLSPRGGDAATILSRYEAESDVTIKRALLLCLGEFETSEFSKSERAALTEQLLETYRTDSDRGLHGAAEWLLRRWGQAEALAKIDEELQQAKQQLVTGEADRKREWYINTQGQTFVILDADTSEMGSPESEDGRDTDEVLHRRRIGRRFAISTKEVTHDQWRAYSRANPDLAWKSDQDRLRRFIRTDDSPMNGMMWYEAAAYCNWLSEQEGIEEDQWCYESNGEGEFGPGMKARAKFWELHGYRLPTEAEWEFACRAGTETSRYYGVGEALLPEYAWFLGNSEQRTWPVASLKPNDFGLFDMQGNVAEWVYDDYFSYRASTETVAEDQPETGAVAESDRRVLRGKDFLSPASAVRSASRTADVPASRLVSIGFRVARTYDLSP